MASSASRVLVAGSGVIGLRTAVEILRRGAQVVVRSAKPPLDESTCSMGAGGLWMPFHCDDPRRDRWAIETLDELLPMAEVKGSAVEIVPSIVLKRGHGGPVVADFIADDYSEGQGGKSPLPSWSADKRLDFQHMTTEMLWWQNSVFKLRIPPQETLIKAGYTHVWFYRPPIVDSPRRLEEMRTEVVNHQQTVEFNQSVRYTSLDDMVRDAKEFGCNAIVNCTGMGNSQIMNDKHLVGARGILIHFERTTAKRTYTEGQGVDAATTELLHDACIMTEDSPWGTDSHPCYVIPRGDKLVVGGTYLKGDERGKISAEEREVLLANARLMGIDPSASPPSSEWVGFCPHRPTSRCELESAPSLDDLKVVHSYGHGGSGWTVSAGVAKEAVRLLGF